MRPIGTASSAALGGLQRQFAGFERAAADVVKQATSNSSASAVTLSNEAPTAPSSGSIEGALVDTRISKYLAIANMRVLKTVDEMEKTAADLIR